MFRKYDPYHKSRAALNGEADGKRGEMLATKLNFIHFDPGGLQLPDVVLCEEVHIDSVYVFVEGEVELLHVVVHGHHLYGAHLGGGGGGIY